ncbi:DNA topoisomerase IB [Rhizobium sp. P38BS-XIX]|uniref:DNA topoisomerase IB n=1 Tax=Rhizobium sp. P38BS-XIX TaxID=2726740 RepID=UPI001456C15E|nr:DNA topoisomerase IB [Rhizobium sp. P38BS-XIX]NLS00863.1 DNA topoisomerase IB [Rhizobium sp. P38BS-XIX]
MLDTTTLQPALVAITPVSGLVYVSSLANGITRKQGKKGFLYFDPTGQRIRDAEEIARINALAIPPAYEDVIISTNPLSHLQAIGIDARGRRQYRYHPGWHEERGRTKFDRLVTFGDHLPEIRERVDRDMRSKEMTMNKALAAIVWMLDNLYIRVGNANYALANGSYGATTLRARHVKADGAKIRFRFKGKSGKEWNLIHSDRRIANVIRKLQDLPGQNLFQYFSEDGGRRTVTSQDVNAYIQETAGEDFSSRQFRTWGATCLAVSALAPLHVADTKRALTLQLNEAIDSVAAKLFNTRAVCRSSYIHPAVFEDFKAGELSAILRLRKTRSERLLAWMDDEEIRVLQWLKAKGA